MNEHDERRITTQFVKAMTLMCVRQGKMLEDLHAGIVPANQTGDYSEVMVTTPSGDAYRGQSHLISTTRPYAI